MINLINWAQADFWMIFTLIVLLGIPVFIGIWLYKMLSNSNKK
ncbi:MAG: hypothetical protein ACM3PT_06650 [Deltaproteobacteria bacterium]